jgi:hypothetical protein
MLTACGPSVPEVTSTKFDGIYVGTIELTANSDSSCFKQSSARIVILNGKLDYSYADGVAIYHTAVYEDGTFNDWLTHKLNGQPLRLKGKVLGDSIAATTLNRICENQLNLKRVSS